MSRDGTSDQGEPIEAVFARLAPVDADALSVAGCDRWLADANRVVGWLTVMRLDVDQARAHKTWAGLHDDTTNPADDDLGGGPRDGKAPADEGREGEPDSTDDDGEGLSADGHDDPSAETGEPDPEPEKPGRKSSRASARDAKINRALTLLPAFRAQLEQGELTTEHVLALDAIRNRNMARQQEAALLAAALRRTAEEFAVWLRVWDAEIDLGLGVFEPRGVVGFRGSTFG